MNFPPCDAWCAQESVIAKQTCEHVLCFMVFRNRRRVVSDFSTTQDFMISFISILIAVLAMSLLIESTAQFRARANEIGLTAPVRDALIGSGLDTMSKLAFWVNQPGTSVDDAVITNAANGVVGGPVTVGDLAAIKRLHFESQAFTLQALKNSIDGPGSDVMVPKKIPLAEKESRLNDIRLRLTGISISGPLEPATSLLEHTMHQHETKTIKYLAPEKCYSREHEIKHAKPSRSLQVEGGTIAMKDGTSIPSETVFTSLQFQQAMTRRAIAYDFAQLMSFDISRRYCDMLLKHLNREPPPGYSATSLSQLIKADQQVWAKLSEAGSDIRRNNAGEYPLDRLIIQTLFHSTCSPWWPPQQMPIGMQLQDKGHMKNLSKEKARASTRASARRKENMCKLGCHQNFVAENQPIQQAIQVVSTTTWKDVMQRRLEVHALEDFAFVASASRIIPSLGTMALRRKRINPDSQDLRLWNTNQCMRPLSSKYSRAQAVSQHGCERLE